MCARQTSHLCSAFKHCKQPGKESLSFAQGSSEDEAKERDP